MGIYVFSADVLYDALETLKMDNLDFGKHVIPYLIEKKILPFMVISLVATGKMSVLLIPF